MHCSGGLFLEAARYRACASRSAATVAGFEFFSNLLMQINLSQAMMGRLAETRDLI